VYLYTHWGSGDIVNIVRTGLINGSSRWNDSEYLARILFDAMKGDDVKSTTGYGIGTSMHGDLDCLAIVDVSIQKVVFEMPDGSVIYRASFSEFIKSKFLRFDSMGDENGEERFFPEEGE
jgi:hypothetical protein